MSWDHRIIKYVDGEGTTHFGIHEVYYGGSGRPEMYTEGASAPYGESLYELREDLQRMLGAFDKPVLTDDDFSPPGNDKNNKEKDR